jgi:hypothetical protein
MRRIVLGIAIAVTSLMPTLGVADDQQIADFIKSRLQVEQQKGNLRGFNVDMRVDRGTVWFKGHVSNDDQEMTILRSAQLAGHLGVVQVVDDIEVKKLTPAKSVMDREAAPTPQPPAMNQQQLTNAAYQQQPQAPNPYRQTSRQEYVQASAGAARGIISGGQPMPFANNSAPGQPGQYRADGYVGGGAPMPASYGSAGAARGIISGGQPMPFANNSAPGQPGQYMADGNVGGGAPMPASYRSAGMPAEAPNLPGYAWPGYAANPNYGAVTYPKQYSPSAWPYIGPFYPYPQVPLGWRKVSLEWDDGWWMLDFHDK